ncbi:MAG TPA: chaperonin GroEL [Candidatus Saccharimonadia bacterium]|jgi:chaperonin GroEL|nr:chaperonin GroEL [Candidatus Saccharimonadia bacterium]
MAKKIFYDNDARARVLAGAKELYDAVKVTMGPKGRNVVVSKSYGGPTVTHDGVTVAKAVEIEARNDETLGRAVGAELVKQAASKTNDTVGDGTTTATVLTYHILNEANKLIAAGHNPMDLKKGLDQAAGIVLGSIDGMTEKIVGNRAKVAQVATISAGDAEIGELIADVIAAVGNDGTVTVEQSQGLALEKEIVEGFKIDRGYVSQYMVTDAARMEAVYEKPLIMVTDKKISSLQEILPVLEKVAQGGKKELVIIAEDVDGDALAGLVLNRLKGAFNGLAIKAPAFGDRRKAVLQDIAVLTGATVITEEQGITFENATIDMLGSARKIIAGKDDTTIIEGYGDPKAVTARMAEIRGQVENVKSEYDKENLEKRLSALAGKVAVIKVGGATETEIEEKKFRVDDAVNATKAAVTEGIVPGGGVTLVDLSKMLTVEPTKIGSSEEAGHLVLKRALVQPFRELMNNAGLNPDEKLPLVMAAKGGQGFDVNSPAKLVDLKTQGVVDPAKVTREAITNAVSIAGTAMTMGSLIVEIPEEKSAPAGGGMPGGMGMGMDY